jgi:hypothetical protein
MANEMNIMNVPRQRFSFALENGDISISLHYSENLYGFFMELDYGKFTLGGIRLVRHYNLLNKFTRLLPFGIQIRGESEPQWIDSFSSGACLFLILAESELEEF